MSLKWAKKVKKAHFGDISYNVFNRRKSSYLILEPLNFTISWRMYHYNESIKPSVIDIFCEFLQYLQNSICQVLVLQSTVYRV